MTERGSAEVAFPVVGELGHAETLRRGPESRVVVRLLRQHPDLQPPPPPWKHQAPNPIQRSRAAWLSACLAPPSLSTGETDRVRIRGPIGQALSRGHREYVFGMSNLGSP